MGSTNTGRFRDYPGTGEGSSGAGQGGEQPVPQDRCARAFSAFLEDVEHCDFFKNHGACPPVGTQLRVAHKKRIVAETDSGEIVGNLPTSLNYLAGCLASGYTYPGTVRQSSNGPPAATVGADFVAVPP